MKNLLDAILEDLVKGKDEPKVNALIIDVVPGGLAVKMNGRIYDAMTVEDQQRTDMLVSELAKFIIRGVNADIDKLLGEVTQHTCKECDKCGKESSKKH